MTALQAFPTGVSSKCNGVIADSSIINCLDCESVMNLHVFLCP